MTKKCVNPPPNYSPSKAFKLSSAGISCWVTVLWQMPVSDFTCVPWAYAETISGQRKPGSGPAWWEPDIPWRVYISTGDSVVAEVIGFRVEVCAIARPGLIEKSTPVSAQRSTTEMSRHDPEIAQDSSCLMAHIIKPQQLGTPDRQEVIPASPVVVSAVCKLHRELDLAPVSIADIVVI